jgi:hypothetical protein
MRRKVVIPDGLDKTAREGVVIIDRNIRRSRHAWQIYGRLIFAPRINVARDCQHIGGGQFAVGPESGARHVPPVITGLGDNPQEACLVEEFEISTVVRRVSRSSPVLNRAETLLDVARAGDDQSAQRLRGFFRDDVDDAIDGVRAPHAPARSANHFDPFDVFQRHVERVPINAAESGRINRAPVDQDDELVAVLSV